MTSAHRRMAGAGGFEPPNGGIKIRLPTLPRAASNRGYHRDRLNCLTFRYQIPTYAAMATISGDTPVIPRGPTTSGEGPHARQDHEARG